MTVDIRLNKMINALDGRLRSIGIEQVALSVRTLNAHKDCGVRTLHDAQMALINRQLRTKRGIGPKAVKEVEEVIFNVSAMLPWPDENEERQRRLDLNSLLLAFESDILHLYALPLAAAFPEDFLDIDVNGSIAKTKARIDRIREKILAYAN